MTPARAAELIERFAAISRGDWQHAVSALRGTARGQRQIARDCADVATLRERHTAQAARLERAADAIEMLAREVGR